MMQWRPLPFPGADYDYDPERLQELWPKLHHGDRVPWPAGKHSRELIEAWRHFHAGRFQHAGEPGRQLLPEAYAPLCKSLIIYADHLEDDESVQQNLYHEAAETAGDARGIFPDDPAAHYFYGYALGRYAQSISVLKALRQGLGGRIAAGLQRALELCPEHPDAHLALGLYHAEIIDKVGQVVARMTYGSTRELAMHHLDRALALNRRSPATLIEYGNGIYLLHGEDKLDEANDCYRRAAAARPLDAMERLDREFAARELET